MVRALRRIHRSCQQLLRVYDSVQVELQGRYSAARLRDMADFSRHTSLVRVATILVLTPIPCLVAILALDVAPLNSTGVGIYHQTGWLWLRMGIAATIATLCVTGQFCQSAPTLPMSTTRLLVLSLIFGLCSSAEYFALGLIIGFPVPFAWLFIMALWVPKEWTALWISWKDALRADAVGRENLKRYLVVIGSEIAMAVGYLGYSFVLVRLSSTHQSAFSLVLPVMKLFFKNMNSVGLMHMEDLAPTTIVFNVDVFHAMYVVTTTQRSPSMATIGLIMTVDVVQGVIALFEIQKLLNRTHRLTQLIESNHELQPSARQPPLGVVSDAMRVMAIRPRVCDHPDIANPRHLRHKAVLERGLSSIAVIPIWNGSASIFRSRGTIYPSSYQTPALSNASVDKRHSSRSLTATDKLHLQRLAGTLKLLHMTEFYVLVEFVEFVIAAVYATYLLAMTKLPSRAYYATFHGFSDAELVANAHSVAMYAALELFSFAAFCWILERQIRGFSTLRQLAFVLRKHWQMVQGMMMLWVLYAVQLSLDHFGTDYSLKLAWLQ